ncbi:MAG: rhodanese-like domain-containing protein [Halothiobacillaceae bacterium]|nr:rhodanese-like domain-containing protein [Halothiobacillaceae bacterium]
MNEYNITAELKTVDVLHKGAIVTIRRAQDSSASIHPEYAPVARACPPYCIQPIKLAEGVETFGELEVLDYLSRIAAGDTQYLVIDSRTTDWYEKVTIPGAINVPYGQNMAGQPTDLPAVKQSLVNLFGVQENNGGYDFSAARTLAVFCNGPWCGQTPNYLRTLLALGYPAEKLKWYRGGMQDWCALGLTTA